MSKRIKKTYKRTHSNSLIISLFIIFACFITAILITSNYVINPQQKNLNQICTKEAKICPDGSSVERTGPNCEFKVCPSLSIQNNVINTDNWKTYTNNKFKYQVKYPPTWTATEKNNLSEDYIYFVPPNTKQQDSDGTVGILAYQVKIPAESNAEILTQFQQFMDSCSEETPITCTQKTKEVYGLDRQILINDKLAFQTHGGCCGSGGRHIFAFNKDNRYQIILYGSTPDKMKNESIFNQILATFTFL